MYEDEIALNFVNLLARALSILELFPEERFEMIQGMEGFDEYVEEAKQYLDLIWEEECQTFFDSLSAFLCEVETMEEVKRYASAYEICVWMDLKITYYADYDEEKEVSLWPLCNINSGEPETVFSLNNNVEDTCIWINPKFPIRPAIEEDAENPEDTREVANKDVFTKMNNVLKQCSYFRFDGSRRVRNVIISQDTIKKYGIGGVLTIAFSPITSREEIIDAKSVSMRSNGLPFSGMACGLKESAKDDILKRTKNDWVQAGVDGADILFMPELLGTKESCGLGLENKRIKWVSELYKRDFENMQLQSPMLTVLPSYWSDYKNSSTIVSQTGKILGVQQKFEPYVRGKSEDRDTAIEALMTCQTKETVVIHVQDVHRIAVLICSEFLVDSRVHWSQFLCASLGVTLLIVPSYSGGEKDFINKLSSYKEFGTTVVWGNCCGAQARYKDSKKQLNVKIDRRKRGIGGCGVAGEKNVSVFGTVCKCNHVCDGIATCSFAVHIPLIQIIEKNKEAHGSSVEQLLS